uniref:Gag-pol polyprotein n=1 Tax=Ascaris lumbricoides TaxID=6252 RepID=A0A0M3IBY7_ASCLU
MEDFSDVITFESADSHSHFAIVSTTIASSESPEEIYVKHNLLEAEMTKTMLNESSTSESDGTSLQMITNEMPTTNDANMVEQNKGVSDEHEDEQSFENRFDEGTSATNPSIIAPVTEALSRASWLAEMEQSAGQIPTIGPKSGHIPPDEVNVTAVCSENGVNVTFSTRGNVSSTKTLFFLNFLA